jgi:5-formyltetrahydrofolate cyclo-ligase
VSMPQSWREIAAWRKEQRQILMAARGALGPTRHRAKSRAIAARLEQFLPELRRGIVGIYWPIRREFDPLPFARRLIAAGGEVALPVVIRLGLPLEFRRWNDETKMATGVYDIPYPAAGGGVAPAVLIVPLLGFDDAGYRLGYGAGYYDRTFASFAAKPLALGVGFAVGRVATIYPQPHDIAMDHVMTEEGSLRRDGGRLVSAG